MLYYFQAFQASGPFVIAIRQVILDVIVFLVIATLIVIGFAVCFVVLFRHTAKASDDSGGTNNQLPDSNEEKEDSSSFGNMVDSMLALYTAALGDFELDVCSLQSNPQFS